MQRFVGDGLDIFIYVGIYWEVWDFLYVLFDESRVEILFGYTGVSDVVWEGFTVLRCGIGKRGFLSVVFGAGSVGEWGDICELCSR
jgi:hypothetical protein